jgi:hypothetical protein
LLREWSRHSSRLGRLRMLPELVELHLVDGLEVGLVRDEVREIRRQQQRQDVERRR